MQIISCYTYIGEIMNVLIGDRLSLRPIIKEDLVKLNQWKNSEEIYQYLGGGYMPVSVDIQGRWLENLMDTTGNNKRFIIEDNKKKAIGMVGLYNIHWIHRTCELGIFLGEISEQGKGYGREAYQLIENFACKYLNLRKIKAMVVKDNYSAVKMYDSLDFSKAGELVDERFIDGSYHTVYIMEKFLESKK